MKRDYIDWNPRGKTLEVVQQANAICSAYAAQGFDLTLRQLYYQFVSRALIPNKAAEYDKLGGIINNARLAGMLDWNYIVDRVRMLEENSHWDSPAAILRGAARSYQEDKWSDQEFYVEVFIEKNALAGVLESVCPINDVPYFACIGYPSVTSLRNAAMRYGEKLSEGKKIRVIHLGDHDPSGIDMTRDLEDRIRMFLAQDNGDESYTYYDNDEDRKTAYWSATTDLFEIDRIALNFDQVEAFNPPPNPAKLTDTRATSYINRFGSESWELDALDPATLVGLVQNAIDHYRDPDLWDDAVAKEERQQAIIQKASDNWNLVTAYLEEVA